jgi:electron transport complex protein RnfG
MNEEVQPLPAIPSSKAMIFILGLVAAVSGLLIVIVYKVTFPIIEENKRIAIERAVLQVVPGATQRKDYVLIGDQLHEATDKKTNGMNVYAAYDGNDELKGIAAEAAAQGYAGIIRLLYGYDPDCECITGIKVIKLSETPGLGDKIITDQEFVKNFSHLDVRLDSSGTALANSIVTVKHGTKSQPWEIDAISGATISSRAVGKALNQSAQVLLPGLTTHVEKLKAGN